MSHYRQYENGNYIIFDNKQRNFVVFDKKKEKYYYKKEVAVDKIKWDTTENIKFQFFDVVGYLMFVLIPMIIIYLVRWIESISWYEVECTIGNFIAALVFLGFNVCSHEFSHYLAMKIYKKKTNIGIKTSGNGFMCYVNTTATYLLPYYKRAVVYAIGPAVNVYLVFFTVLLGSYFNVQVFVPAILVITYIIINMIPIRGRSNDFLQIMGLLRKYTQERRHG